MRHLSKGFLMLAVVLLSQTAYAYLDSGWYAGGGVGWNKSNIGINDTYPSAYGIESVSAASQAFFGYRYNPNFALETDFIHIAKIRYNGTSTANDGEVKGRAISIEAVGVLPIQEQLALFVEGGLYQGYFDQTNNANMNFNAGRNPDNDIGYIHGMGIRYMLTPEIGVTGEWQKLSELHENSLKFINVIYLFEF